MRGHVPQAGKSRQKQQRRAPESDDGEVEEEEANEESGSDEDQEDKQQEEIDEVAGTPPQENREPTSAAKEGGSDQKNTESRKSKGMELMFCLSKIILCFLMYSEAIDIEAAKKDERVSYLLLCYSFPHSCTFCWSFRLQSYCY